MRSTSIGGRPGHRFWRFVGLLATAAALSALFLLVMRGQPPLHRISIATAFASLLYLAAALIIGPLNIVRARPNPLSTYLRRDIGIVAAILALAHTILGLQVHLGGDFPQYFLRRTSAGLIGGIRLDAFGWANHSGLLAILIILMLLGISNNLCVRKLGPAKWKGMQRWLYAAGILVIAHGLLYQALEGRKAAFVACLLTIAAVTMLLQWLGFRRRSRPL